MILKETTSNSAVDDFKYAEKCYTHKDDIMDEIKERWKYWGNWEEVYEVIEIFYSNQLNSCMYIYESKFFAEWWVAYTIELVDLFSNKLYGDVCSMVLFDKDDSERKKSSYYECYNNLLKDIENLKEKKN